MIAQYRVGLVVTPTGQILLQCWHNEHTRWMGLGEFISHLENVHNITTGWLVEAE